METRFLVDANVGRLARWLRAMGYDTRLMPGGDDTNLIRVALQESRILLTRDSLLVRRKLVTSGTLRALHIRSDDYLLQLRQVVEALGLDTSREFSRCMECNHPLRDVPRHQVQGRVPPYVFQTQQEFRECPSCQKLYWRGTHWARMRAEMAWVRPEGRGREPRRYGMTRRAAFVYSDILSRHVLRENHVMVPTRLRYTYELLEAYGVFQQPGVQVVAPRQATVEELLTFHSQEYVDAVRSLSQGESAYPPGRYGFSQEGDNPVFQGMYEAYLWSTGASLRAAELLVSGQVDVAFNPSGGLHHAVPGHASGFCVFNDPVIAINHLLEQGFRVAYVDIDCHHGDGVQHAFYDTDQVLTISLHEAGTFLFPGTGFPHESGTGSGVGHAVNVPLFPYTYDELYLWAFREVVPPLVRQFQPDVLVTQLGLDTHFQDPITHLALTVQGFAQVVQELGDLGYPWLALGGGGYDLAAVARGWALAYGVMVGIELADTIPQEYQERYGLKQLRDSEAPPVDSQVREQARRYAEQSVEQVKQGIFPHHGL